MRHILLDVTRLNTRKRASTPSGIDRVDLRYVEHFSGDHIEYVISWLGCLFLVRKPQFKRLCSGLKSNWQEGGAPGSLPLLLALAQTNPLELLLVTLRNLLPDRWGIRQRYSRRFNAFISNTDKRWLYINTSHVQLRSVSALKDLATRDHVEMLFFIHDLIPITHREYVRPGGAEQHQQRLQLLVDTKASVICNSEYTRAQLDQWAAKHGGEVTQSKVIPIGVDERFLRGDDSGNGLADSQSVEQVPRPIPEGYFLMLGTIEPRKNHLLALNAWRRMAEEGRKVIPKLVIIGKRGWENENIVDMLERCDAIKPYIIEKQHVTDDELLSWFIHCEAMIYPSFVEGWGMPVAEALALGRPVICSDIPPFREVGQGQATYIDPLNGLQLISALRDEMIEPVGYKAPTWEAHFQLVDDLLSDQ